MLPDIKGHFWKEINGVHFLAEEGTERVKYVTVPDTHMPGLTEVKMTDNKLLGVFLSEQKAFEFCAYLIETQQAQVERIHLRCALVNNLDRGHNAKQLGMMEIFTGALACK